jgi:hypothetical protein
MASLREPRKKAEVAEFHFNGLSATFAAFLRDLRGWDFALFC